MTKTDGNPLHSFLLLITLWRRLSPCQAEWDPTQEEDREYALKVYQGKGAVDFIVTSMHCAFWWIQSYVLLGDGIVRTDPIWSAHFKVCQLL